jgi:hypothetical protein
MCKQERTREDVIKECAMAVASCWNYYGDTPLTRDQVDAIQKVLGNWLPARLTTKRWKEYADDYQRRCQVEEKRQLEREQFLAEVRFNEILNMSDEELAS